MPTPWELRVYENQNLVYSEAITGRAELGRQNKGEDGPYGMKQKDDLCRVIIARLEEDFISRKHVLIEPLDDERFRLTNLSQRQVIRFGDGRQLGAGAAHEGPLPLMFTLGLKTVRVQSVDQEDHDIHGLVEATVPPGGEDMLSRRFATLSVQGGSHGLATEDLVRWIQAAMGVLQSAASSLEFFPRAAKALVDLVGLDSGRVLLLDKGDWKLQAHQSAPRARSDTSGRPSRQVLAKVLKEKRTFWQAPSSLGLEESLVDVKAIVAAPILNPKGEVIGAIYGDRRQAAGMAARPITKVEAMLVDLLASGVATGLARVEQEQAALRAQVLMEQFFTPEISRQLAAHPELLAGRDTEVSILFCDIRGFSRVSERLGPERTVEWIGDVMGALSECVQEHGGVLVDYIGDELMAMWGAPVELADHAERACRAALAMHRRSPALNQRWQPVIEEEMSFGIGINTGVARVGNVGSKLKFKYGPLGNTVNLSSRVQGATKYLKTPVLITEATRQKLGPGVATRRLCRVRVVNIADPVDLYELVEAGDPQWERLKQTYEEALTAFENKQFRLSARRLGQLLDEHPNDGPSLVLMSRTVNCLVEEPETFDPAWQLPGK
jgi:adenylate cyclase